MTRNVRNLPLSKVEGHWRAVPHRASRVLRVWAHPLLQAERPVLGWVRCSWGLVGRDRPHEPRELAGEGDGDLLLRRAAPGHPPPAAMQALLRAPCALDHERIQVALTAGELVSDLRAQPPVPGRLDQQPTNVLVPALVIDPRRWDSSEECSVGTRPTNAMNRLGGPKPRELARSRR